jgi:hypothetical protein
MPDDENNNDNSVAELLVHSMEISVRTSIRMMKIPLVMYAGMVDQWAKAVDSMADDMESRY